MFASLQAHAIVKWLLRSAAIFGESDDPAIDYYGRVLESLKRPVRNASGSKIQRHFRANVSTANIHDFYSRLLLPK